MYFVVVAIFSNGGHLGFLTWTNFIILSPWSLILLHVNFDNNWCSGFREKNCLELFKYVIFRHRNLSKDTNKQKVGHCDKTTMQVFFIFIILNTHDPLIFHAKILPKISSGCGEVHFVIFAILYTAAIFGYST